MKKLSHKEAIRLFRKQWQKMGEMGWSKERYFRDYKDENIPFNRCYLCEWAEQNYSYTLLFCEKCPIDWGESGKISCESSDALFSMWVECRKVMDIKRMKKYALLIAKLPERKK